MKETKRGTFSKEEVESRLSRRRFAMATTGAAVMALGSRNAWAQVPACPKCDNTAKVFGDLSIKQLFDEPERLRGIPLTEILTTAIGVGNFPDTEKRRLIDLRDCFQDRDEADTNVPKICYRDFFVTPGATTFDEVIKVLVPEIPGPEDDVLRAAITAAMTEAIKSFHFPIWKLPGDNVPLACKHLIDGWPTGNATAAGLVKTFGDEKLHAILNEAPDYSDTSKSWRWRAHLLHHSNQFGMTSMSGGAATNYQVRFDSHMLRMSGGANQCAAYTGSSWACQTLQGSKCVLDHGEPAEGTDLCNPPPS